MSAPRSNFSSTAGSPRGYGSLTPRSFTASGGSTGGGGTMEPNSPRLSSSFTLPDSSTTSLYGSSNNNTTNKLGGAISDMPTLNPPVVPSKFAPVEIDTSDPTKLKEMIQEQHEQLMKLHLDLEVLRNQRQRVLFHDPSRKLTSSAIDAEYKHKVSEMEALKSAMKTKEATREVEMAKMKENFQTLEQELRDEIEYREKKMKEMERADKEKFDNATKAYEETIYNQEMEIKKLKEDIQRIKAKNVLNIEAKDAELESLRNEHKIQLTNTRQELEKQRLDELTNEKSENSKRFDDMKNKLDTLVTDLTSQVNKLTSEKESLEKSSKDQLTKLNTDLATKSKSYTELNAKFEALRKENEKLNSAMNSMKIEHEKFLKEKDAELQEQLATEKSKARDELEQAREISLKNIKEKDASIVDLKKQLQEMTSAKTLVEKDLSTKLMQTEEHLNGQLKRSSAEYETRLATIQKSFDELKAKSAKDSEGFNSRIEKLVKERDTNKINFEKEKSELLASHQKQIEKVTERFKADIENLKALNLREKEETAAHVKSEDEKSNKKKMELEKELRSVKEQLRKATEEREHFEKLKTVEMENLQNNYKLVETDQKNALKKFEETVGEVTKARQEEIEKMKAEHKSIAESLKTDLKDAKSKAHADILDLEQALKEMTENLEKQKRENISFNKKKEQEIKILKEDYERKLESGKTHFDTEMKIKLADIEKLKKQSQDQEANFKNEINNLIAQREKLNEEFAKEKKEFVQSYEQKNYEQTKQTEERVKTLENELNAEISKWKDTCTTRDETIHKLNMDLQDLKSEFEKFENSAKKEMEHMNLLKEKEVQVLNDEINFKKNQISDIEAKHASQLDELQDEHKDELYRVMSDFQAFKNETDSRILALHQQKDFEMLNKNHEITDLSQKLENLKMEKAQEMEDYEVKLRLLKDENEKSEKAMQDEHAMQIKMKNENIESLEKNIEFHQQEQAREQDHFREVLKGYREHFTEVKIEIDNFVDELSKQHDMEKQKLNLALEELNQEKVRILEEWKKMEKELTESYEREIRELKETQMATVKALDEELRATQEALKDMTLQRDVQIDENQEKGARIDTLEKDANRLRDDINTRMEEMTEKLLKLESEKKAEFESHQKEMTALNDAKNAMEVAKDKAFNELKDNMEHQIRQLKADTDAKIAKQSQDKQNLNLKLKDLNQKFTGMVEEKDAVLSRTKIELVEKHEDEYRHLKSQHQAIIDEKSKTVDNLMEKLDQQRRQFEHTAKVQKSEFQKILNEKEEFTQKLKEEHSQSMKEVEEHCEMYKTNAEAKVKELNATKKSCKETVNVKDSEIERFLVELTDVRGKLTDTEATANLADNRAAEVSAIQEVLMSKADEIASLITKCDTMTENEKEHVREIENLTGEVYGLKNKVTGCETEIRDINYRLQSSEQYAYSLRKDLDEKEKQIGESLQKYQHEKYQNQAKDRKIEELKAALSARSYTAGSTSAATSRYDTYDGGSTSSYGSASASKWSSLKSEVLNKNSSLYSSNTGLNTTYDTSYDSSTKTMPRSSFMGSRDPSPSSRLNTSSLSSSGLGRSSSLLSGSTYSSPSSTTSRYSSYK